MLTFLLIEDDLVAAQRYAHYIRNYDQSFTVLGIATDASEAKTYMKRHTPDIIISDIQLPGGVLGLDLLLEFRNQGWRGCAVILTGYSKFEYAQRAIQTDVFDYILKPVFHEDVCDLLNRLKKKLKYAHIVNQNTEKATQRDDLPEFIIRAIEFIEKEYASDISLTALAEHACVSESYLSSSFHKFCGMTITAYLNRYRIQQAKKLLLHSNMEIKEIACATGLQDPSYFYRCFRKLVGMTPKRFKELGGSV